MNRKIFVAFVLAVNLASAAAFIYLAVSAAIDARHDYPSLDTWEHHQLIEAPDCHKGKPPATGNKNLEICNG